MKIFEKLEDECSRLSEKGATGAMWVRVAEHAKKIALINCVADDKSEISAEHAEYACELVKFLTKNTCTEIFLHLADNDNERVSKRIERLFKRIFLNKSNFKDFIYLYFWKIRKYFN